MNNFEFSDTNKRYHTLEYYNRKTFGQRVFKASLDASLSCPNIDGAKGVGGCAFCLSGSGNFVPKVIGIENQLIAEIERIDKKKQGAPVCAYFQAHTNTYADVDTLRSLYQKALDNNRVCSLAIATRPDCIDEDIADLLCDFSLKIPLTVELGLQTAFDETARRFNRCYGFDEFLKALDALQKRNIRVCVHIINGLPFETQDMMVQTASALGKLGIDAIKIQLLHILRNTRFEKLYNDGVLKTMQREDYIKTVVRQLEVLPPSVVVERLTGDGDAKYLTAPLWSKNKITVLNDIDKLMAAENTYQGRLFSV